MVVDDPHTPRTLLFLLHISKTCTYNYLQKKNTKQLYSHTIYEYKPIYYQ